MKINKPERVPLLRSMVTALVRTLSVALGVGSGLMIYKPIGPKAIAGWPAAAIMFFFSFLLFWFLEYERENIK